MLPLLVLYWGLGSVSCWSVAVGTPLGGFQLAGQEHVGLYRFDSEHEPETCVLDHYFIPTPGLHIRAPPRCPYVTRSLPYMGSTPNNPRPPDMGVHCYTRQVIIYVVCC